MDIGIVPGEIRIFPAYQGVTETPPGVNGPTWALVERKRGGKGWPRPLPPSPNRTRRGGGAPLSFLLSPSFLLSYSNKEGGGVLLPVGGELLLACPSWPADPSPWLLYIRGQGAPLGTTTIDPLDLLAVRCPPSTIIHLDNIVGVLR